MGSVLEPTFHSLSKQLLGNVKIRAAQFLPSAKKLLTSCTNPIIHLFYPPKICIGIVFDFSWDIFMSQEKLQTMVMQTSWPGLLEAWLALISVKYHGNLWVLIPRNQRLALTMLRTTGPWGVIEVYYRIVQVVNKSVST